MANYSFLNCEMSHKWLSENLFHAIPIVEDGKLTGILTTLDIIKVLVEEDNARIKAV